MSVYVQQSTRMTVQQVLYGWEILTQYTGSDFEILFDSSGNVLIGITT